MKVRFSLLDCVPGTITPEARGLYFRALEALLFIAARAYHTRLQERWRDTQKYHFTNK